MKTPTAPATDDLECLITWHRLKIADLRATLRRKAIKESRNAAGVIRLGIEDHRMHIRAIRLVLKAPQFLIGNKNSPQGRLTS